MKSEEEVTNAIEIAAAYAGLQYWRNNSGACVDQDGRQIRYGLGNISAKWNARFKSPDYVGIVPVFITPQHVGTVLGVFVGAEHKKEGWKFRPSDEHAVAQMRFHEIVRQAGGYAGFAQSPDDLMRIIGRRA